MLNQNDDEPGKCMEQNLNIFGQPTGPALENWQARTFPEPVTLTGQYCRLEPLNATQHTDSLYQAFHPANGNQAFWTYLSVGPFDDPQSFSAFIRTAVASRDPLYFAVVDLRSERAVGLLSLMRTDVRNGVTEVGHVMFSPSLQRTLLSTEAQFLLMQYVFSALKYRRYEWKCDSLNAPSRNAALRLGFQFEGIFRQAVVYKGRSRDTAWFSVIDSDWPVLKTAFQRWLSADNFNAQGEQQCRLQPMIQQAQAAADLRG